MKEPQPSTSIISRAVPGCITQESFLPPLSAKAINAADRAASLRVGLVLDDSRIGTYLAEAALAEGAIQRFSPGDRVLVEIEATGHSSSGLLSRQMSRELDQYATQTSWTAGTHPARLFSGQVNN